MLSCRASTSVSPRRTLTAALLVLVLSHGSGCGGPETIELVAIHGCGLEQEFSGLRVRVLGDLAPGGGSEVLLGPNEQGSIPALHEDATGIAAEGLFGTTVTAVGRSYGIDPELAAGRIPGFGEREALLPIYFAEPDSLCALDEQPSPRESPSAAGPAGDLLLAGGVDDQGALLDELVHVDLFTGELRTLAASLPSPRRGHAVHALPDRRFLIIGGAESNVALDQLLIVDMADDSSDEAPLRLDGEPLALANHASARSDVDGRILLAGGCDDVDAQARCEGALGLSLWLDSNDLSSIRLPDLAVPRQSADALVGADGVAWIAGGLGADGLALGSVERLVPGGEWEVVHTLPDGEAAAGFTLLDGGLVLIADASGTIHWWSEAGSGSLDPTSRAPALEPTTTARPLSTLPGERVLVDTWLFDPATASVDPATERVLLSADPRLGAELLALPDGTVLFVGGETAAAELVFTPLLRLRPRLDGPDEWIPELTGPQTDAFVGNAPGRATVVVGGVRLDAVAGEVDVLPPVRVHVRGFRSRSFRLEFDHAADSGALAHVTLEQGSNALLAMALGADGLVARRRLADGSVEILDCGASTADPGSPLVLEVDDAGRRARLSGPDGVLATCVLDWPSSAGLAVGFGASGAGSARFFGLRLARR
jgi:hypothetical protein